MIKSAIDKRAGLKNLIIELASVVVAVAIGLLKPAPGLGHHAMLVLGLLAWAIINWVANLMPDFAVAILMCCAWVILGILPFSSAFAAFSSNTVWLLIGALGIGAAVVKSGLLSRTAILVMRICPATFTGQVLAMLCSGMIIGPFIPSSAAKVAIVGCMSTDIGQRLGFANKSKGMAGLWCAMYTGFTLSGPIVMSSSYFAYMILALMPDATQQQFTFGYWFLAMIPWGLVILLGSYGTILLLYKPKTHSRLPKEDIQAMLDSLGPMQREEKITSAVLLGCIFFWIMERQLGIPAVVTAVCGLVVLLALGVLTVQDYVSKISWNLIAFVGGVINLSAALSTVGIDNWLGNAIGPVMSVLTARPYLFVLSVAVLVLLVRLLLEHMTCFTMFILVLSPCCISADISPWIIGICAYAVIHPWFFKYQNVNFLIAYYAAGGDEVVGFGNTVSFCFTFCAISIIGLLVSVPYWRFLGLFG